MKLKWYNAAMLLVESGDTRLLIDPFLPLNPKLPPVDIEEAKTAQAIFITHPHPDHFPDYPTFCGRAVKAVYVSDNGISRARASGYDTSLLCPIEANGVYRVGNLTVRTYQGRHCRYDLGTLLGILFSPRTYFRYFRQGIRILKLKKQFAVTNDIYVLEISDGDKRILVLGSAGLEERNMEKGCDMLVFPYQGKKRMHRCIGKFLQAFQPKCVFLDHFDDAFPPFTHRVDLRKCQPAVKKVLPEAQVMIPKAGEWYKV